MKNSTIIFYLSALSILLTFTAHSADFTGPTVLDAIKTYNKVRVERYAEVERTKKEERRPLALDLDQMSPLLQKKEGEKSLIQYLSETENGEFSTKESAEALLKEAISPKITVTRIETLDGGFVSGEIYRVVVQTEQGNNENYFIKYLRKTPILVTSGRCYGEQANLIFLMNAPQIQEIQDYITIILPELIAKYTGKDGKEKVFIILPGACGESFTNIVRSKNLDLINEAFGAFGSASAQMDIRHRLFTHPLQDNQPLTSEDFKNARVPVHTDLHGDNIFYCLNTKRISLIDVETMANSFDSNNNPNGPIGYDLLYMLLMSPKKFGDFMPKNNEEPFKHLVKAYTDAYSSNERVGIYNYLEELFDCASKVGFKDLFKHFTWEKRMSSQAVTGAKKLAEYVRELRRKFEEETATISPDTHRKSDLYKTTTEESYKNLETRLKAQLEVRKRSSSKSELPQSQDDSLTSASPGPQSSVKELTSKLETSINQLPSTPDHIKKTGISILHPKK